MSTVTIATTDLANWRGPTSDVELRLALDQPISTPEGQVYGSNPIVVARAACQVASATVNGLLQYTLTIPAIDLPATENAIVGRTARYTASFHKTTNGQLIQAWPGFESFRLPAAPTATTWAIIRTVNDGGIPPYGDTQTFSRSEILSLFVGFLRELPGWDAPTGTLERTTFATYTAPVISNPPTQAEVQAIANALQNVSRRLAALISDTKA